VIRKLTPPEPLPGQPQAPITNPPRDTREPSPLPGPSATPSLPPAPAPRIDAPSPIPNLEPVKPVQEPSNGGLTIPRYSPGRAIQQSLDDAARRGGAPTGVGFDGVVPGAGGGGPGQEMGGGLTMLTPTEGVDFNSYLARVLASVRRNWYSIIPESARMGEKGKVYIDFEILRDGSVPPSEPILMMTSGKNPLDRAAMSSIRASSPFEPLPSAFGGPLIKLRFVFYYNITPPSGGQ
jgi:TonB family protein